MSTRGSLTERKGVSRCVNVWDLWSRVQGLNSALQAAKKISTYMPLESNAD